MRGRRWRHHRRGSPADQQLGPYETSPPASTNSLKKNIVGSRFLAARSVMRLRSLGNIALGKRMTPSTLSRAIANPRSRSLGPWACRGWSCTPEAEPGCERTPTFRFDADRGANPILLSAALGKIEILACFLRENSARESENPPGPSGTEDRRWEAVSAEHVALAVEISDRAGYVGHDAPQEAS
jgi:hypothetical protein